MQLHRLWLSLGFLLVSTPLASAQEWVIDPAHSDVGFSVRHMMISTTKGEFTKYSGTAVIDEANPTRSKVELEIDVASVDTGDAKRDDHLRGEDFFAAKQHPKMTFKSTKITRQGKGYRVTGDLTLKGVTKPVTLDVTLTKPVKTPFETTVRGVSAEGTLNRKAFGVSWNQALDSGGLAVGDEVTLDIELELVKK